MMRCPDTDCAVPFQSLPQFIDHVRYVHNSKEASFAERMATVERYLAAAVAAGGTETPTPIPVVRRDCVWCGRERSAKDDNHGPECPYWDFFGPAN